MACSRQLAPLVSGIEVAVAHTGEPGATDRPAQGLGEAGLAPLDGDGDTFIGERSVWSGQGARARGFCVAVLVAMWRKSVVRAFWQRLCAADLHDWLQTTSYSRWGPEMPFKSNSPISLKVNSPAVAANSRTI